MALKSLCKMVQNDGFGCFGAVSGVKGTLRARNLGGPGIFFRTWSSTCKPTTS